MSRKFGAIHITDTRNFLRYPSSIKNREEIMDKKKVVLKTELAGLPKIYCSSCNQITPHRVIASHETRIEYENQDLIDRAMQIVRCETCETVTFRELYAIRGFHEENSEGIWVDPVTEILYPRPANVEHRRFSADESTGIFD